MKKKGFTLVELLAVIAILAILVIMALPAVLRMFTQARKDSFTNEVNTLIRTARQQYLLSGGEAQSWSNAEGSTNKLDLTGNSKLIYYVEINGMGQITKLQVTNGDFQYNVTNNNGIDIVSSSDVVKVTNSNQLVINPTGSNIASRYFVELDGGWNAAFNTYQEAIAAWGHPFFIKKDYNAFEAWCVYGTKNGITDYNSCNDDNSYFTDENECNDLIQYYEDEGYTYTCNTGTAIGMNNPVEASVGFVKDGNVYYLKYGEYETNANTIVNVFGTSNCIEEEPVTKSNNPLMTILGIMDVHAFNGGTVRCTDANITVTIDSSVSVLDDVKRCDVWPNGSNCTNSVNPA